MLGLRPNPEFERWMESIGLLEGGEPTGRFGDARVFQ
jgi:ethanolamine ammonia-lyase large subunit